MADFLLTSLANLRKNLKNPGSNLIIRQELPEKVISQLADLRAGSGLETATTPGEQPGACFLI